MGSISHTVTKTNFTTAYSYTCYVGDSISITNDYNTRGVLDSNIPSGCTWTRTAPIGDGIGTVTGTATAIGTWVLTAYNSFTEGSTITITVESASYTYYSNLYYDANTGSDAPATDSSTTTASSTPSARSVTISSTVPSLTGYKFLGWSTTQYTPGTGTASYVGGNTISVAYSTSSTSGTTLYAVWQKLTSSIKIKVGDTWKSGTPYVNVDGTWKKGTAYINVDGTWKKGS